MKNKNDGRPLKNIYLNRYATKKHYFPDYQANKCLDLIVVIPCHNESNLLASLQSLNNCKVDFPVEVIVVINASETDNESVKQCNLESYDKAVTWVKHNKHDKINYHFILENELPKKHAGVGTARKIGMDEAVRMFDSICNHEGVILCFDADCSCQMNLLSEVRDHFRNNPKSPACSVHFEHPLEGAEATKIYEGIVNYELHLRYYIDALKFAGFSYAHQTIGSSMAVRSSAYQKQGGMNRRKAGEDFYFLHKIMPLGNFTELNSTMVIPSPRRSDRVPFGTGRAIGEWLAKDQDEYYTYAPNSFIDLKAFFDLSKKWQDMNDNELKDQFSLLPISIQEFVLEENFIAEIQEINRQSTTVDSYKKRFNQWWDGFKVLKYVHFCRDNYYENVRLDEAVNWLFTKLSISSEDMSLEEKLIILRKFDKSNG